MKSYIFLIFGPSRIDDVLEELKCVLPSSVEPLVVLVVGGIGYIKIRSKIWRVTVRMWWVVMLGLCFGPGFLSLSRRHLMSDFSLLAFSCLRLPGPSCLCCCCWSVDDLDCYLTD